MKGMTHSRNPGGHIHGEKVRMSNRHSVGANLSSSFRDIGALDKRLEVLVISHIVPDAFLDDLWMLGFVRCLTALPRVVGGCDVLLLQTFTDSRTVLSAVMPAWPLGLMKKRTQVSTETTPFADVQT